MEAGWADAAAERKRASDFLRATALVAPISLLLTGCGPSSSARETDDVETPDADGALPEDVAALEADANAGTDALDTADALLDVDAATAPLPPPGPGFHREGPWLLDAEGRVLVLHGVNVANSAKYAPDFLPWESPEDFAALADHGFDSVRLLGFWAAVMPAPGWIDHAYLDAYAERVEWAHAAGLLVVLDMHQDLFGVGFGGDGAPRWACDEALYASYVPREPWYVNYLAPEVQECFDRFYADDVLFGQFQEAWLAIAARIGDHPAVVGFDLLNEPFWGSLSADEFIRAVWQPRMEQLAAALRVAVPDRVVFFQGTTLSSLGRVEPFVPAADPRTALAPHYYHPLVHDGFGWDPAWAAHIGTALDGIAASAERLGGVPVWLGEFGAPSGASGSDEYIESLVEGLAARGWGWAWYDDGRDEAGFGTRLPDGSFKRELVRRLGHPTARRIPGAPLEVRLDFTARRYEARFVWTRAAPLELWIGRPAGHPGAVGHVEREDTPGEMIPCAGVVDAPAGLRRCPASSGDPAPVYGATYRAVVTWDAE